MVGLCYIVQFVCTFVHYVCILQLHKPWVSFRGLNKNEGLEAEGNGELYF